MHQWALLLQLARGRRRAILLGSHHSGSDGLSLTLRSSWALRATTIVDRLMRTAPTAGGQGDSCPCERAGGEWDGDDVVAGGPGEVLDHRAVAGTGESDHAGDVGSGADRQADVGAGQPMSLAELVMTGRRRFRRVWQRPTEADRTAVAAVIDRVGLTGRKMLTDRVAVAVGGVTLSYHLASPPGATIALVAVSICIIWFTLALPKRVRHPASSPATMSGETTHSSTGPPSLVTMDPEIEAAAKVVMNRRGLRLTRHRRTILTTISLADHALTTAEVVAQ